MRRWTLPVVKTTTQRGFSLIELMIVLVIIGVLAAVAIPNYQGYVARAKVTKLIQFISPYQQRYSDYYLGNGNAAPADTAALQQRIFGGATAFSDVGIAAVVQDSAKTGFVVTVSSSYVGTDKNGYLKFSLADKDGALIWSCSAVTDANGATKSTIGDFIGMLPDNCR